MRVGGNLASIEVRLLQHKGRFVVTTDAGGFLPRNFSAKHRTAIELEPKMAAPYNNLGGMLAKQGSLESAINYLEEAVKHQGNLADAHYNLGLLLIRHGDRERGEAEIKKAQELNPLLKAPEN